MLMRHQRRRHHNPFQHPRRRPFTDRVQTHRCHLCTATTMHTVKRRHQQAGRPLRLILPITLARLCMAAGRSTSRIRIFHMEVQLHPVPRDKASPWLFVRRLIPRKWLPPCQLPFQQRLDRNSPHRLTRLVPFPRRRLPMERHRCPAHHPLLPTRKCHFNHKRPFPVPRRPVCRI